MVKFGRSVSYLFGLLVNYSAFQFSIYSVLRIWSNVPVRAIYEWSLNNMVVIFLLIYGWVQFKHVLLILWHQMAFIITYNTLWSLLITFYIGHVYANPGNRVHQYWDKVFKVPGP